MYVYIARHGETQWNVERRIQGNLEVELNAKGRAQARLMRKRLETTHFAAIITSSLSRAVRTAEPLAEALGIRIQSDERLREMGFGELEGMEMDRLAEAENRIFQAFWRNPTEVTIPGGEDYRLLHERVSSAYEEARGVYPDEDLLFVAHKQVNRALLAHLTGTPLAEAARIEQPNDHIFRVELSTDSEPRVTWSTFDDPPHIWREFSLVAERKVGY
jgi:probable phosphoglycerate mutase